MPHESRAK